MPSVYMTRPIVASACIALLVACGTQDTTDVPTSVRTEIDTINGVEHVRNAGVPPSWRLEEILRLGSEGAFGDPAPDEFGSVASAILGPGDRVYVADGINAEVKVFDLDGSLALKFGRKGEGPGEFGRLYSLAWIGDTLLALDFGVGRVAMFDAQGRWIGQRRHPGRVSGPGTRLRLYQTGDDEAYAWSISVSADRMRNSFVRHTSEGATDTLWQIPRDEALVSGVFCEHASGIIGFFEIPFAPQFLQHPAQEQLIAVVRTDVYRIAFLNNLGDTVRVVERAIAPVPTNTAEWNDGLREYREFRDENPGASCEPRRLSRPDVQPPVRNMLLAPDGRLWIEAITPDGAFWEVFDPSGRLVGRVPVFPQGDRTVPYFAERHIVAVSRDSLDVHTVTVYELGR